MRLTLYAHPFSSYCQKVLTALYGARTASACSPARRSRVPWTRRGLIGRCFRSARRTATERVRERIA
jgi:hypothetical protein